MPFGLRIRPDGWSKDIDITASSRILSALGRYQMNGPGNFGDNVSFTQSLVRPATGGILLPIPVKAVELFQNSDGNMSINCLRGITANGSTMTVNAYHQSRYLNANNYSYDVTLFEIPAAQPQTYGISMTDATDFCTISDVNRFGYVTWSGTITISGEWAIPSTIPNRANCVVFARWNNTSVPLYFDRNSLSIKTYTSFGGSGGASQGGTVSNVQIVIVSVGFNPPLPTSGYGIVIRNAASQITFSSAYPPVIWRGGRVSFPFYIENDTSSGSKIQWNACTGNVALPMAPLGNYGFQCGDFSSTGNYPTKVALRSGLLMSGNSVSTYRAQPGPGTIYYQSYPVRAQMGMSLPVLDAADYF